MTRELLLARRLLEAVVDPELSVFEAEDASIELAELTARLGVPAGRTLPIETFEGMAADDLSPSAWLHLLENRPKGEPEIPPDILHSLFHAHGDAAVRFRLISGALSQPETRAAYLRTLEEIPEPDSILPFPDSFPKRRLQALQALAGGEGRDEMVIAQRELAEFVLYLLQDGSKPSLALAAGAIAPGEYWRTTARRLVQQTLQVVDPQLQDYGRTFRRVRFEEPS
jgi:hypothetical protein